VREADGLDRSLQMKKALRWLTDHWWGLIVAYAIVFGLAYVTISGVIEPIPAFASAD
jgi:hypothetical protein